VVSTDRFASAQARITRDATRSFVIAARLGAFVVVDPNTFDRSVDVVLSRSIPAEGPPPPLPHTSNTRVAPVSDYFTVRVHPAGGSVSLIGGAWRFPIEIVMAVPPRAASIPTSQLLVCTYTILPNAEVFGGPEETWEPIPAIAMTDAQQAVGRQGFYLVGSGAHREIRILARHAGIFALFRRTTF